MTFVVLAAVVAVIGLGVYFNHDAKVRRELRKSPVRPIRELGDGERGRIVGAAKPGEDGTLVALVISDAAETTRA